MQKNKNILENFEKNLENISLQLINEESYLDRIAKKVEDAVSIENIFDMTVSAFKKLPITEKRRMSNHAVKKIEEMRKEYEKLKTQYYKNRFKKNIGKNNPEYKSKVLILANRMKELEEKINELKQYVIDEEKAKVNKKEISPISTDIKKEDRQTQIRHAVDMLNVARERYKRLKSPANKQELIRAKMNLNRLTGTVGSPGSLTDSVELVDDLDLLEEGIFDWVSEKINPSQLTKFKDEFYVPSSRYVKRLFEYYKLYRNFYNVKDVKLLKEVYDNLTAKGQISLHNIDNGTIFVTTQYTYFKFLPVIYVYTILGSWLFQKNPKLYNYLNQIKLIKTNYDEDDMEKKANLVFELAKNLVSVMNKVSDINNIKKRRIDDIKIHFRDININDYLKIIRNANQTLLKLTKQYKMELDQEDNPTDNSDKLPDKKKKGNKKIKKKVINEIEKVLKSGETIDAEIILKLIKRIKRKYPEVLKESNASIRLRRNARTGMNKLVLVCKSGEYKKQLNRKINIGGSQVNDVMCLPKSSKPALQKEKDRKAAVKRWKKIHANPAVMKKMVRKRMETKSQSRTIR